MTQFTPVSGVIGGVLIGLSAALLLWGNGRVAGISGIIGAVRRKDLWWRVFFVFAMGLGGGIYIHLQGSFYNAVLTDNYILLAVAGLFVGFGTRLGSGCTSGHGVCGLSRLSYRSLVAVIIFMTSAATVVFITRHVI